jgi:site-specific DNA recombinase
MRNSLHGTSRLHGKIKGCINKKKHRRMRHTPPEHGPQRKEATVDTTSLTQTPSTNGHSPKRAVLYARVSTDEQAKHGYSIDDQLRQLRDYAEREGLQVVEEVIDDGFSGSSPNRPGLERVLEMAERGEIDIVLASKRDRFFRSRLHRLLFDEDMKEHGVSPVALDDTGNMIGDSVLDSYAEWERSIITDRTKNGRRAKAWKGEVIATNIPTYGFRYNAARDGYEIDDANMATVRRIFESVAGGETIHAVVDSLNREGLPSPRNGQYGTSGKWGAQMVRRLLLHDAYKLHTLDDLRVFVEEGTLNPNVFGRLSPQADYGVWRYSGVVVPIPSSGIPRETVEAARSAISGNRKASSAGRRFWTLSGGILRCGVCGSRMETHTATRGKGGKRYFYYRCRAAHGGPVRCENKRVIPAESIEAKVQESVGSLNAEGVLEGLIRGSFTKRAEFFKRLASDASARVRLAERIEKLEARRSNLIDMAADGTITRDDLKAKLSELEHERDSLQEQLAAMKDADAQLLRLELQRDTLLESTRNGFFQHAHSPEERRDDYLKMGLTVLADADGEIEISGDLLPESVCDSAIPS